VQQKWMKYLVKAICHNSLLVHQRQIDSRPTFSRTKTAAVSLASISIVCGQEGMVIGKVLQSCREHAFLRLSGPGALQLM
jgi:hypothetical protein